MAADFDAARIGYHQLERQSVRERLPVHLFDDDSDVDVFSRPVDPTIGKQEAGERSGLALGVEAAGVESRQVQAPIVALVRQKGKITLALSDVDGRGFLAREILESWEGGVSASVCLAG